MEIRDTLKQENVFSDLKMPTISELDSSNFDIGDVGKGKLEALKNSTTEINTMIDERGALSKVIFREAEKMKTEINNFLLENEGNFSADLDPRDLVREKNDLRHKKIQVGELQLNEKISAWKDIALLKRELRETERELTEKQERVNTMNKILE
jgi:hypothetical protein